MYESLGATLRELREAQNLTREQLYARTKILPKYIEALENGRWDLLPGQMYVKPFVKSLSDVLSADYASLCAMIDKQESVQPQSLPPAEPPKKHLDYRWLVAGLLTALTLMVIFIFKSYADARKAREKIPRVQVIPKPPTSYVSSKRYSAKIDFPQISLSALDYRYLELTSLETIKLTLTAGGDTLYSGLLEKGATIKHKSTKPFSLDVQKSDCLDIMLDGQKMNQEAMVKGRRYIVFPGSGSAAMRLSGVANESK